jgi:16S rRNA (cytidine1402-2'-O)-methyltransferase
VARGAGRLYVVATPIGNLGDLTPRAREVLGAVDCVAAEDTRVTRRLLSHAGVSARLLSYRDENERRLAPLLVRRMNDGESIALVSDAGTPGISDPGYRLVHAAAEAGIEVIAIPGPCAAISLLSIAGLPTDRFSFEGFPPASKSARAALLASCRGAGRTIVFYESPRRAASFLGEVASVLGDPRVAVGRELTKMHEEVLRGRAGEVAVRLEERAARGEVVIAVYVEATGSPDSAEAESLDTVRDLIERGFSTREIAARMKPLGLARRRVYEIVRSLGTRPDAAADEDDGASDEKQ